MWCLVCSSANVVLVKEPRTFTGRGGNSAVIEVQMYKCNDCDGEFFDPAQAKAVSRKARDAGILPPKAN